MYCLTRENVKKRSVNFYLSNIKQVNILRKYYDMVFPSEMKENEYVRLVMIKPPSEEDSKPIPFARYAKDFQEYVNIIKRYRHNFHIYNSLCTVKKINGELGGTTAFQRQRRVLYLDFDLKDYPELKEADAFMFTQKIKEKFPNLFIHAYYASGGGFHFYIAVKPTCNWRELVKLNADLVRLTGSDPNANKPTQIVRVPTTYNLKYTDADGKHPYVKQIINSYQKQPENGHKGYYELSYIKSLVTMAERGNSKVLQEQPLHKFDYTSDDGWMDYRQYPCLCNLRALKEGVIAGERNTFMGRLIFQMLKVGENESHIHAEMQKWNLKCRPPKSKNEVTNEVNGWLKGKDNYNMGGCYESINDPRVRAIVEKYCDKSHCYEARHNNSIQISSDIGVKMNKKVLTRNHLNKDTKGSMGGYEYLILTVLDKYIPKNSKQPFTIADLKKRLQHKSHGKWNLCMDLTTLKKTINALIEHKCIIVSEPTEKQCKKKNPAYDDNIIKLTRRLKDINNVGYIEFYYSSALAFICRQISQNEYKVFLCLLQQMEDHKPCTLTELSNILGIEKSNVSKALINLDKAQCIEIASNVGFNENGQPYNIYRRKSTNIYNNDTYNDDSDLNEIIADTGLIKDREIINTITIKLLA